MTAGTCDAIPRAIGPLPSVKIIEAGERVSLNGLTVTSFSVSHDAADPVSYVIEDGAAKLGIAADLGYVSDLVKQRLAGSHALILESNYCPDMLRSGSYPPLVQQRIRGRQGHLSNKAMSSLLAHLAHDALRVVVLVHISEENNTAGLAYRMAERAIRGHRAAIHVAPKHEPTPVFELAS
jgi:phosphoribosyl 1,2-cyclic phosphodiesterase